MNKKYVLPLLLLASSMTAQAQLESGFNFVPTPGDLPHFYFDMMRDKYPYILRQHRFNLNGNNWLNYRQMHSVKNSNGHFVKLGIDVWNTADKTWESDMSYDYAITYGTGGKIANVVNDMNSDVYTGLPSLLYKFEHDGQGNINKEVMERDFSKSGNYLPYSERFITYDSQNRMTYDSTAFDDGKSISIYTYIDDTLIYRSYMTRRTMLEYEGKETIRKDNNGRLTSFVSEYVRDITYSADSMSFTYNNNSKNVLVFEQWRKSSDKSLWTAVQQITHEYRPDGEPAGWVSSLQAPRDSTAFLPEYKFEIVYKGNKADSAFSYFWTGSTFDTRPQQRYIFGQHPLNIADKPGRTIETALYPNPANNELFIKTNNTGRKHVRIYDIAGRLVQAENITGNKISVSTLRRGQYLISIDDGPAIRFEKQ